MLRNELRLSHINHIVRSKEGEEADAQAIPAEFMPMPGQVSPNKNIPDIWAEQGKISIIELADAALALTIFRL